MPGHKAPTLFYYFDKYLLEHLQYLTFRSNIPHIWTQNKHTFWCIQLLHIANGNYFQPLGMKIDLSACAGQKVIAYIWMQLIEDSFVVIDVSVYQDSSVHVNAFLSLANRICCKSNHDDLQMCDKITRYFNVHQPMAVL